MIMKKIFTLIAAVMMAAGANAQVVEYYLGDLKVSDFELGDAFVQGNNWTDETGSYGGEAGASYETISYTKKDKTTWSDLKLKNTPFIFQFKNSGEKAQFYRLFPNFFYANGKQSRITITGLSAGQEVMISAAGKNDTGAMFVAVENCTADASNPTTPVGKETEPKYFSEFWFKVTANGDITIEENSGGYHICLIAIIGGGSTPVDPTPATQWDFTKELSSTDLANLEADTENWAYDADNNRYSNAYVLAKIADGYNDDVVNANGEELELTKGLTIGRYNNKLNAGNLRIDNGKRLGLNGSDVVIGMNLVANDVVKIRYGSTNNEARGFKVVNADKTETALQDNTGKAEETLTVVADGKLILQTTAGLFVYAIAVNDELPEEVADGISVVAEKSNRIGAIYNLAGQQVRSAQKGVYIQNGRKYIVK